MISALRAGGLHVLDVPDLVAAIWRAVLLIVAVATLGAAWTFVRTPWMPLQRRLLMLAFSVVVVRFIFVNGFERWNHVVYWEGLPVDTLWLSLLVAGLWHWFRCGPPRSDA